MQFSRTKYIVKKVVLEDKKQATKHSLGEKYVLQKVAQVIKIYTKKKAQVEKIYIQKVVQGDKYML